MVFDLDEAHFEGVYVVFHWIVSLRRTGEYGFKIHL